MPTASTTSSSLRFGKRVLKVCRDTGLILAIAFFLLLGMEITARVFLLARVGWDEYLKYEYRHDPVYLVSGERELNSLGFRGREFSVRKPRGVTRFILVGGSEVFGVYVTLEDSLPVILERKLKEAFPKRDFEVVNAGRLGSVAANEALLMEQLVNLEPNGIIVFNGWNDIYHARYLPGQYEKVMQDTTEKFQWDRELSRWFRRHLWTVRKIREWRDDRKRKRREKEGLDIGKKLEDEWIRKLPETKEATEKGEPMISFGWSGGYVHYPLSQLPPPSPMFKQGYCDNLIRMAQIAKRRGIPIILIFQPDLGYHKLNRPLSVEEEEAFEISTRVFSKDWFETVKKLYPLGVDTMRKAAEAVGVPFYDFSLALLDAPVNGFGDTVHLNGFGNAYVAKKMTPLLQPIIERT